MLGPTDQTWPSILWLVRHGESAANIARDSAEAAGLHLIDIAERDVDVPLSRLGERQSCALGEWFAQKSEDERPTVVLCSPYLRATNTAALVVHHAGLSGAPLLQVVDERLREKEFGILDRLTKAGIEPPASARREVGALCPASSQVCPLAEPTGCKPR